MIAEKKYDAITSWLENGHISFWYNIFSVCNCFLTFLCDEVSLTICGTHRVTVP